MTVLINIFEVSFCLSSYSVNYIYVCYFWGVGEVLKKTLVGVSGNHYQRLIVQSLVMIKFPYYGRK